MLVETHPVVDDEAKSRLCAQLIARLPLWFGRPDANAHYIAEIVHREVIAAWLDGRSCGLIALDYRFAATCDIWWLGIDPAVHRRGLGRALIERAARVACARSCRYLTVATVSARVHSAEYNLTRMFYDALGFVPVFDLADDMVLMLRAL